MPWGTLSLPAQETSPWKQGLSGKCHQRERKVPEFTLTGDFFYPSFPTLFISRADSLSPQQRPSLSFLFYCLTASFCFTVPQKEKRKNACYCLTVAPSGCVTSSSKYNPIYDISTAWNYHEPFSSLALKIKASNILFSPHSPAGSALF